MNAERHRPVWTAVGRAATGILLLCSPLLAEAAEPATVEMPRDVLVDKIRGGMLGQLFGNLNGLQHEFKYYEEPGGVEEYTPGLPDGARTDDDTDIEWVYVVAMERDGVLLLPYSRVAQLWRRHVNRSIWCANAYARWLMDLGIDPPDTGHPALNPWANFNLSGQFLCEAFGLMAPGMPRTAAQIGTHYTRVAVDREPVQATQLFTAMIATAFLTDDIEAILDAGVASLDRESEMRGIAADVRRWHAEHPDDWRATRRLIQENHVRQGVRAMPDANGHRLNAACVLGALLYGAGDFRQTMILAFNLGWDADCNAATAGTIVGVMRGQRWMLDRGWTAKDVYRNTTRDAMPDDETITGHADRIAALAERVILDRGGAKREADGRIVYTIAIEKPGCVEPLRTDVQRRDELRRRVEGAIDAALGRPADDATALARAAYLAVCLDLAEPMRAKHPDAWTKALDALAGRTELLAALWKTPGPDAQRLRARVEAAGLRRP